MGTFPIPNADEVQRHVRDIRDHFSRDSASRSVMPIFLDRSNYKTTLNTLRDATQGMPKILVFSSSRDLERFPVFAEEAAQIGAGIANTNGVYAYGNGNVGMMGMAASSFIAERNGSKKHAHHIVGICTPNFYDVEDDYPGVVPIIARDLDLRERLMIDYADAIIVLRGGIGTDAEESKFLSQDGYFIKSGRPIIFQNTEYEHPKHGLTRAFNHRRGHLQEELDLKLTTPRHLENVYFSRSPEDTIAFLLERVEGLEWTGKQKSRPALDDLGIEKLDFDEMK